MSSLAKSNDENSLQSRDQKSDLIRRFKEIRRASEVICEPLEIEDFVIQSMPDVSPMRWHLAHTTWFFETFLLKKYSAGYDAQNESFEFLFNSYYNSVGKQFPRTQRGLLSRPTVSDIFEYRHDVDKLFLEWLSTLDEDSAEIFETVEIGLQHEQQHQELMLTDIKHILSCNPISPKYRNLKETTQNNFEQFETSKSKPMDWISSDQLLDSQRTARIGFQGHQFCFDNELPLHEVFIQPFVIADRLVTNREYIEFIDANGYSRPEFWLSMGFSKACEENWQSPLYWEKRENRWFNFTLDGLRPVDLDEPVTHISYFEADAYASFVKCRLLREFEWEAIANHFPIDGNLVENNVLHPTRTTDDQAVNQLFGDCWEWTSSQYSAYPGYSAPEGAIGEYNGKFMCNQFVLRGGSCVTPKSHIRPSYRNFFPPDARWQFAGIRLAKDI